MKRSILSIQIYTMKRQCNIIKYMMKIKHMYLFHYYIFATTIKGATVAMLESRTFSLSLRKLFS